MASKQIVVIGAHPDDEILGAGATLARHVQAGDDVHAVVVSEGASSRCADEMKAALEEQARESARTIGFASLRLEGLPDQRLDTVPFIELTQRLEAILEKVRPHILYTHFPEDVNADHGLVAKAAWTACRPYSQPQLEMFAVFATPSSSEWTWPTPQGTFRPNYFVDVTDTIDVKVAAMACYRTELRPYPHPRSERALRERAAYWGSVIGRTAVEPFEILRRVR
ncbi:MAG: PIG-L deacetylase family protein [Acidimicrobiales bacterium]